MIAVSLVVNVLVLVPVTVSLALKAKWTGGAFGPRTPARDILLAIYFAILGASVALLAAFVLMPTSAWQTTAAVTLLVLQIIYKVLTAVTVTRSLHNPVVLSNLAIVIVHLVTVLVIVVPSMS